MRITAELLSAFAHFNQGVNRAREAYYDRDLPTFADCPEPRCGPRATCPTCRGRARRLLVAATSEDECAELLTIIERPSIRVLVGCGSEAGYQRHRRSGERACARCRSAHSAYCQRVRR